MIKNKYYVTQLNVTFREATHLSKLSMLKNNGEGVTFTEDRKQNDYY